MEGKIFAASLLNTYVAATAIAVDTSLVPSVYRITGLQGINKGQVFTVRSIDPVAEVQQVYTIGGTVAPVVTASTSYQIRLGDNMNVESGYHQNLIPYTYVSPAVLTGTAATDRFNMYYTLAQRINRNQSNYVTAYNLITITQTNTAPFAEGEIVTQSVSGAVGINMKTAAGAAAGTTGTLTLGVISGTFTTASATLTGSITGTASATAATITLGLGLRIVDDAGYYPANNLNRAGVSTVILPTNSGWATPSTMLVKTTTGAYSFGQGTRMLQDVPVLQRTDNNLASGTWEMATNNAPIAGATYQCYQIFDNSFQNFGEIGQNLSSPGRAQVLWLQKTDASGSPNAAFAAADARMVGATSVQLNTL